MLALAIECPVAIYGWRGSTGGVLPTLRALLAGLWLWLKYLWLWLL
jgi:hypothetical protein